MHNIQLVRKYNCYEMENLLKIDKPQKYPIRKLRNGVLVKIPALSEDSYQYIITKTRFS